MSPWGIMAGPGSHNLSHHPARSRAARVHQGQSQPGHQAPHWGWDGLRSVQVTGLRVGSWRTALLQHGWGSGCKIWIFWRESRERLLIRWRDQSISRLGELGLFILENRKLQVDLIKVYKHLKGGCKEQGARLFLLLRRGRTRGNEHKMKHRRCRLNSRKYFFSVRGYLSTGTGCSKRLCSLLPWRYLKAAWATGSWWPCLSRAISHYNPEAPFNLNRSVILCFIHFFSFLKFQIFYKALRKKWCKYFLHSKNSAKYFVISNPAKFYCY